MTEILTVPEVGAPAADTVLDDKDPKVRHVFRDGEGRNAHNTVQYAIANGIELIALCGVRWTPTRNGASLPVCKDCLKELDNYL